MTFMDFQHWGKLTCRKDKESSKVGMVEFNVSLHCKGLDITFRVNELTVRSGRKFQFDFLLKFRLTSRCLSAFGRGTKGN